MNASFVMAAFRCIALNAFIFIAFNKTAHAASDSACELAFNENRYREAASICLPLAEHGNAAAQYIIGTMYNGNFKVFEKNFSEEYRWLRMAADQGYGGAFSAIGGMYARGDGFPKNKEESFRWYKSGADRGDRWSQVVVADFFGSSLFRVGSALFPGAAEWGGTSVPVAGAGQPIDLGGRLSSAPNPL